MLVHGARANANEITIVVAKYSDAFKFKSMAHEYFVHQSLFDCSKPKPKQKLKYEYEELIYSFYG